MSQAPPRPRKMAPDMVVETPRGQWSLKDQKPDNFTLLVIYRGRHCPLCKKQLEEFNDRLGDFVDRGVNVFAVSMDEKETFDRTRKDWDISDLAIGYGMTERQAGEWGLFLSRAIKEEEPALFSEPGVFLVRPDGDLYSAWIQSVPFARPTLDAFLKAIDIIVENDYPARGEAG